MRRLLLVVSAICLALGGCSSNDERAPGTGVTVDHRFGTTTVDGVPERVVTIDLQWTDVMLAMGVEPVGYSADPLMPDGVAPWQDVPESATALSLADGLPYEDIVELEPDLIVANFSAADQETYDKLSGIAPTIPNLDDSQVGQWQDLVEVAGEVLDRPDEAADLIEAVETGTADVAGELPGLADKTFALAQYVVGDQLVAVGDPDDASSRFFGELGMTLFGPLEAASERTGDARVQVSPERSDLLEADLLAFLINGGDESDLDQIPGFDDLPGTVALLDYQTIVGINTPTPLSIPYALQEIRPFLEDAAA